MAFTSAAYSVNETQDVVENKEIEQYIDDYIKIYPIGREELPESNQHYYDYFTINNSEPSSTTKSNNDYDCINTHRINGKRERKVYVNQKYTGNASTSTLHHSHSDGSFLKYHHEQLCLIPPYPTASNEMQNFRQRLPTWNLRSEILNIIQESSIILITGGTGCGKTTQVPQFLLEQAATKNMPIKIICTQPRRLPAIAVAKRVAKERGEKLGETVGYHIRLEQSVSERTILTYCTSGVLLRKLTSNQLGNEITHIILDEIHERETNTDYLLIVLKQLLHRRKHLKLILMSATMEGNRETFMNYFSYFGIGHIDIPSRLFSVQCFHLAEILALTGYMPKTECGMFDSNAISFTTEQDRLLQENTDNGFRNGGFRGRGANMRAMHHQLNPHIQFNGSGNEFIAHTIGQQQAISFENIWTPNFHTSLPNNGSWLHKEKQEMIMSGSSSRNACTLRPSGGFGSYVRGKTTKQIITEQLQILMPNKPEFFEPKNYLPDFYNNVIPHLSQKMLVETYMDSGGRQWRDSIDSELTVQVVKYLMDSPVRGGILVFLPGYEEINDVYCKILSLYNEKMFCSEPIIYTLHSQLNSNAQQKVFDRVKYGKRKVVLSTNIAEASLTIDDIVFVIDCGKAKEKGYNHNTRVTRLVCNWIAKSNAEQRRGRAGRCQSGYCFRLYTHDDYSAMPDMQLPEIQRTAIHDICLHAKMFAPNNISVKEFLKQAPDPPDEDSVTWSLEFLELLGALHTPFIEEKNEMETNKITKHGSKPSRGSFYKRPADRCHNLSPTNFYLSSTQGREPEITELGRIMACLPLEPQVARLLLFGLAFKCFNPIVTLVAAISYRDPFLLSIGEEQKGQALIKRDFFSRMDFSDHLMLIRLFFAYESEPNGPWFKEKFCETNYVNEQAMRMIGGIKSQLIYELKRLKLLPRELFYANDPLVNVYSGSWPMVQAVIVAGTYPNVGYVRAGSKLHRIRTYIGKSSYIHPSSCLKRQVQPNDRRSNSLKQFMHGNCDPHLEYFVFQELIATDQFNDQHSMKTITAVSQYSVALFAGPIRMNAKTLEHFELLDPDGLLRKERENKRLKDLLICTKKRNEERKEEKRRNKQDRLFFSETIAVNSKSEATSSNESDLDMEQPFPIINNDEIVELDQWFGFRGSFKTLQNLVILRFRIMNYFIHAITNPIAELSNEDKLLLKCVNDVLTAAHHAQGFFPVEDLPGNLNTKTISKPILTFSKSKYKFRTPNPRHINNTK